ncbi:MAG: lipopolysaccharide transport system ATP-binding protein [Blastocatellia bacterium]|jgi:lipopolysaccharide transport system ATP-binding protein|nr:lipopolysaccharide transport system ATP-binding protein [Blastocatellia bacterium]
MKPILRVENVSKEYRIGTSPPSQRTLREIITDTVAKPFKWGRNGLPAHETIWALKNVNFEVQPGEVVGIMGKNGAGKSTLLKILSRVTEPTTGRIELYGRLGSLLEVGTGFHAELTGRENVFLTGAILGMSKAEVRRKFDEIVAFSEIEKFIDTPVKWYSSGMFLRLAFAVSAHLEPEILLLDEVLAVGDMSFQQKCFERMKRMKERGTTILLVSHSLPAIQRACGRSIFLKDGRIAAIGETSLVIPQFRDYMRLSQQTLPVATASYTGITIGEFEMFGADGRNDRKFQFGESVRIRIKLHASRRIDFPLINFGVSRSDGVVICNFNNWYDNFKIDYIEGDCSLEGWLPPFRLIPFRYGIHVLVWQSGAGYAQEDLSKLQPLAATQLGEFTIEGPSLSEGDGVFQEPALKWVFTRGDQRVVHTDINSDSLLIAFGVENQFTNSD